MTAAASPSRSFSAVLSAPPNSDDTPGITSRMIGGTSRASVPMPPSRDVPHPSWSGARRPTSGAAPSSARPPPAGTAAAAAAAPRRPERPVVPRVRSARDALLEKEAGGIGPTAQDGTSNRATPFALESVLPPVPKSFKCPITHEVMKDPVMTQDGNVYENDSIQEWFRRGHRTSPVTGAELTNLVLLPEVPLRRAIEEYMALRPEIARRELNLRSDLLTLRNVTVGLEEELAAKTRLLDELRSSSSAEVLGPTARESSSAPPGPSDGLGETTSHRQRSDRGQPELGGDKETFSDRKQPNALPPMLASLPTPCRDGVSRTAKTQLQQQPQQASQAATAKTTKLQELMKAMGWRGRTTTESRLGSRSQSLDSRR